jgi:hypothetical protein
MMQDILCEVDEKLNVSVHITSFSGLSGIGNKNFCERLSLREDYCCNALLVIANHPLRVLPVCHRVFCAKRTGEKRAKKGRPGKGRRRKK